MGAVEFFEPMRIPLATHNALVAHVSADGRPGIHKKAELLRAEGAWESHLGRHAPEHPFAGPVAVSLAICRPTEGRRAQGEPCTSKPDIDNWEKTILDVMAHAGYFLDDAQVVDLHACKMWSDPQGIWVRVEELPAAEQDGPAE